MIAEAVETESQLALLTVCGCREFQGHLTGMPQPARFTEALLGLTDEPAVLVVPRAMPRVMPRAMRRG